MRYSRVIGGLVGVLLAIGLSIPSAWAAQNDALVSVVDPVYTEGLSKPLSLNTRGGVRLSAGTASPSPPAYSDGASVGWSFDLNGNARVTLGTLIAGEDQTNNLMMTSGGVVRKTTFSSVTSATTSAVTTVPTGAKTFEAQIINGTSETKAATVDIYGNLINSTTGGIKICTITLPSTVTVLQLQDVCPITTVNFSFYFYTVTVYTSASSAPFTLYAMY